MGGARAAGTALLYARQRVRAVLEEARGLVTDTCGSDRAALAALEGFDRTPLVEEATTTAVLARRRT